MPDQPPVMPDQPAPGRPPVMPTPRTPREVAEEVRKMVAGEGVVFADLFAPDGVLAYPFAMPGQPAELSSRDAIREYFSGRERARGGVHHRGRRRRGPRD